MSKTLEQLKQIQQARQGKYSKALEMAAGNTEVKVITPESAQKDYAYQPVDKPAPEAVVLPKVDYSAKPIIKPLIGIALGLVFLMFAAFNLKLFMSVKASSDAQGITLARIEEVKSIASSNQKQAEEVSARMQQMSYAAEKIEGKVSKAQESIRGLAQDSDSQKFAVENLIKAKNQIFERLAALEATSK